MTTASLIVRAGLLGLASGSRATLGVSAPLLLTGSSPAHPARGSAGRLARIGALLALGGELTGDKLPVTPPRSAPEQVLARLVAGATGASTLARREGAGVVVPVVAGLAGAAASTYAGLAWRRWSGARRADWHGAVAEDAVALGLAALAVRRRRR